MLFYKTYSVQSRKDTHTYSLYKQTGICILLRSISFLLFCKTMYYLHVCLQFLTNIYIIKPHIYNFKGTLNVRIISYKICIPSRKVALLHVLSYPEMFCILSEHFLLLLVFKIIFLHVCLLMLSNVYSLNLDCNLIADMLNYKPNILSPNNTHIRTHSHFSTHILKNNLYIYNYKSNESLHKVISIEKYEYHKYNSINE